MSVRAVFPSRRNRAPEASPISERCLAHLATSPLPPQGMIGTDEVEFFGDPFDDAIGIDHVDEDVALFVATAHDLHLLEEQRTARAEHILTLVELRLEAGSGPIWRHASEISDTSSARPSQPLESALLRDGEVAGDASTSGSSRP